ncbi:uroporphyrinogen-III synthase [Salinarimonas soli]|uniref:Uroporphyrinogen-III synthase n=1 Tax=Salinarimonas soli TaxID=1638099 RepID=A0A5B2VH98_9HYPH|nr:uroporphyrinogen-III synthase [Salinarimonas soli]KAA2237916.1 uroporphyrinogen-III synthase [Salinarimonas soli]
MRVLVTRPMPGAGRTARHLAALGHEAILAPLLIVRATGEPLPDTPADALLVTSAQAVPFMAGLPLDLPVYAVGERTGADLREAGFSDVRVGGGDAAALARLVVGASPPGGTLLHVAGRERKAEPGASLAGAGFRVLAWAAYEAATVPNLPETARQALVGHKLDIILHFSRRTAATLLCLAGAEGLLAGLRRVRHLCLSDDIAAELAQAGLVPQAAARPDEESLLALLDGLT